MGNYIKTDWTDFAPPAVMAKRLDYMEAGIENAQADFMVLYGLAANRPASVSTSVGRIHIATDTGVISRDNGTSWDDIIFEHTTLVTKTSDYTITDADGIVIVDATTGNVMITLPTAVGLEGRQYTVKRIDASINTVTVQGAETIDDAANQLLNQYNALTIVSDDTEWWIV